MKFRLQMANTMVVAMYNLSICIVNSMSYNVQKLKAVAFCK